MTERPASPVRAFAIKVMRRVSLYATLTSHRMLAAFGHRDYVQFIVLTRSRTGSNLLLSFLNSHPHIFCEGEIFAKLKGADPLSKLRRTFGKQPRHIHAKGFKIFYYHPLDESADELWQELERCTEIRVIHLTRDNVLRTLLSRKIAGIKDTWTGTRFDAAGSDGKQVSFTTEELESGFRQTRAWEDSGNVRFRAHQTIQLSYEGLVKDPHALYRQLLVFLDLPENIPSTGLRQQNPETLRELISNYDELKIAFTGSAWESYFEN